MFTCQHRVPRLSPPKSIQIGGLFLQSEQQHEVIVAFKRLVFWKFSSLWVHEHDPQHHIPASQRDLCPLFDGWTESAQQWMTQGATPDTTLALCRPDPGPLASQISSAQEVLGSPRHFAGEKHVTSPGCRVTHPIYIHLWLVLNHT